MSKLNAALVAVVAALSMFFYCYYFSQADEAKEQSRTIAVTEATEPEKVEETAPAETKPKETKPENKYGRYEKMEDGSTQFIYYSHKAMVNDYGYDPCHKQGDIDFEAPDSWMYDDYTDRYYRPGDIIWHEDVDSSAILDMGYNFEMEVLYVTFRKNEATYAYYDVPYSVWDDFCCADSYGGYLNKKIKGKFEYERID